MTDNRITNPLTVIGGVGTPESGTGCAMQVVSYTNGDAVITDYPKCSHPILARLVQSANDTLSVRGKTLVTRRGTVRALSPADAMTAVELGFATVGTADDGDDVLEAWLADARVLGVIPIGLLDGSHRWHIYWSGEARTHIRDNLDHLVEVARQLIDRWHELAGRGTPAQAREMAEASL